MNIPINIQMIKWRGRDYHHNANKCMGFPTKGY
ncbi:hypothetical protein NC651_034593 [Populus alba x Populus x berolinensis]|nr:hypothetical protein NC651_034593 [Populus alba x Populus x berolinensis]